MIKNLSKPQPGLSLITVLIAVTIIIVAGLGIWNLFNFSLKIIADNKSRTIASALANEKIEIIRNLPYDNIGTIGGIPSGSLQQTEAVIQNNAQFSVQTKIFYVDDPYDNLAPDDLLSSDYKKIKITVDWPGRIFGEPVIAYTNAVPKGVESDLQGGTIRIIVFNAAGEPIPEANVQIINNELDPPINTGSITDQNGILLVPGAPPAEKSYEISASKTNYSTEKTYPQTPQLSRPTKPHASVIKAKISEISFTIDIVGVLNITTIGKDYPINWEINLASTTAQQLAADICVDNLNYYYFVWQDNKDTSSFRIYAQKYSASRVAQWPTDKRISTANNQIIPRIACQGTNVFITWHDDRNGNQDSYLVKLDSGGNYLWSGDKKIDTANQSKDQIQPGIAVSSVNSSSFIVFQENSGPNATWDVYLQKYDSNGNLTAEIPAPLKVNDNSTTTNQISPQIAFFLDNANDDQGIYITWQDNRHDHWDIYAQKYNATGTPLWSNNLKINTDTSSTTAQINPKIAVDNEANLYITWADDRNGNFDIYAHKYNSLGSPVWPAEIKINTDTGSANQTEPAIAIDSANQIFISWTDERYFDTRSQDIFAHKLDNNGNPIWPNDELLNADDTKNSNQTRSNIAIDKQDFAIFVWQDDRNEDTDTDIYAAHYKDPGTIINRPNVPLIIKGTKQIYDEPVILKFDNNSATDSNGTLQLINVEWDSYTVRPQSTSTYTFISSNPPQPFILDPGQTVNLELNVE